MRIVDDTANWADAVRAQAEYVTPKAQFSLADLQDSREFPLLAAALSVVL